MTLDDARLLIDAITVAIAVAALVLGIVNYRQARRRDKYELRAAVTTSNIREQSGEVRADTLIVELTNTGQRPVTVTDIAVVWRKRGLRGRWTLGSRRLRRRQFYQWHGRLGIDGVRLEENHPHKTHWRWADVEEFLRRVDVGAEPVLASVSMTIGHLERASATPSHREPIERTARDLLSGALTVWRPPGKK
jgi:hypothetical protein